MTKEADSPLNELYEEYVGRKSYRKYSDELAVEICAYVASDPKNHIKRFCQDESGKQRPDRPSEVAVYSWLRRYPEFAALYEIAKNDRIYLLAEETISIADDRDIDPKQARNMIDARKWFAARMCPKVFSDRIALTGAKDGDPITIGRGAAEMTDAELLAIAQGISQRKQG